MRIAPRVNLKILFLVIAILAIILGYWTNVARKRAKLVDTVTELGGRVVYDWQYDDDGQKMASLQPSGPQWIRDKLGEHYVQAVERIDLAQQDGSELDLRFLRYAENLQILSLRLSDPDHVSLKHLAETPSLRTLYIWTQGETNLEFALPLKQLREIQIFADEITDLHPLSELTSLEKIWLTADGISDMGCLAKIPSLEWVNIRKRSKSPGWHVAPPPGFRDLQRSREDAIIVTHD